MNTYHVYTACMSPALNGSSMLECFEGSSVIEICNGMFNFYRGQPHVFIFVCIYMYIVTLIWTSVISTFTYPTPKFIDICCALRIHVNGKYMYSTLYTIALSKHFSYLNTVNSPWSHHVRICIVVFVCCMYIPYSGKFLRGRNFHDFRDQTPARKNLFP